MNKITVLLCLIAALNVQAQKQDEKVTDNKEETTPTYTEKLFQHKNVFIGGQPKHNDFDELKASGITKIINMRTPSEIEKLDFFEDYVAKQAGIEYRLLPIGGKDHKYSPQKLEEFAQMFDATDGKVLLHCGSGYRASQLWAAYLVKHKGKSPNEALELVKDMGWWPMPMEIMVEKKLNVTFAE